MTPEQWAEFLPAFSPAECGQGMDLDFMRRVMALRGLLGVPMIVHEGYAETGHAPRSYHGRGRALDFHAAASPRQVLSLIDRCGCFGGAGYYPWWSHPGFHIDDRPAGRYQRWVSPARGEYVYLIS